MAVIYFDLDGTLLNSARCSIVTAQQTFQKFCGFELEDHRIVEKMGIPIEVSFRELSDNKINDDNWDEVATYFRAEYKKNSDIYSSLYDGIEEFLKDISPNNQLFIVTSKKSEAAENNLSSLRIRNFFKEVIGSDKVEHYKPHPDPIFKARKFLAEKEDLELMVGDADTDIEMGKSAGIKTCAVTWGAHSEDRLKEAKPDFLIRSVNEMRDLILSLG